MSYSFSIPPGAYQLDGAGGLRQCPYVDAHVFSFDGASVPTNSPQLAGPLTLSAFLNETPYGDRQLSALSTTFSIENAMAYGNLCYDTGFNNAISGYYA